MDKKQQLIQLISNAQKIMVTTHKNPDGDATGSVLGMKEWLDNNFPTKEIKILITGRQNDAFDWWEGTHQIKWVEDIANELKNFDLAVFLDSNGNNNMIQFSERFDPKALKKVKSICIDHHTSFEGEFDLIIHDPTALACCQIIEEQICTDDAELTPSLCRNLLLGVMFDSGFTKYIGYHNARVLLTFKRLIELGKIRQIDPLLIGAESMDDQTLEIIKNYMANTTNVNPAPLLPLTYSYLDEEVAQKFTEEKIKTAKVIYMGFVLRKVRDHIWGFVVTPKGDYFSVSFRSLPGGPNLSKLSQNYFKGGGHMLAAGGSHYPLDNEKGITAKEVCQKVIEILKTAEVELTSAE